MPRVLSIFLVAAFSLFLMACPVGSSYPLGEKGAEKLNQNLVGSWKTEQADVEVLGVRITKIDEYSCRVEVTEKGSMFMADTTIFTGWQTSIEDKTFLVLEQVKANGSSKDTYYVYAIRFDGKTLITNDITLKVGGTDAITSTPAYREEVKASMKMEGFLAGEIKWAKK